jgi:hypothetical protein
LSIHPISALWVHQDTLVDLILDGDHRTTTENHLFWDVTDQAWEPAENLDPGDLLLASTGQSVTVDVNDL